MQTVRNRNLGWLAGFLGLAFGAAALGGYFTSKSVNTWYPTLRKPRWNPPPRLFGPVWTVLYFQMAISAWLVHRGAQRSPALAQAGSLALAGWIHQLILNVLWSYVFFGRRQIGQAVGAIVALWFAIVEAAWLASRVSKLAAVLLLPYLAWTTFAGALNVRVWWLNRR